MIINMVGGGLVTADVDPTQAATSDDIVAGKEALNSEGELITGSLPELAVTNGGYTYSSTESTNDSTWAKTTFTPTTNISKGYTKDPLVKSFPFDLYRVYVGKPTFSGPTTAGVVTAYSGISQYDGENSKVIQGFNNPTVIIPTGTNKEIARKNSTLQLTTQAGKTVTPTTSQQTAVAASRWTTGAVYVQGDSNLTSANIVVGKTIFGVTGTALGINTIVSIQNSSRYQVACNYSYFTSTGLTVPSDEYILNAYSSVNLTVNTGGVVVCTVIGTYTGANISGSNILYAGFNWWTPSSGQQLARQIMVVSGTYPSISIINA